MSRKLEPFLKCKSIIKSESPKEPQMPFRIVLEVLLEKSPFDDNRAKREILVYMDDSCVLGENLCKVHIETMHSKKALIRLTYKPEFEKDWIFWVPREQIEWH